MKNKNSYLLVLCLFSQVAVGCAVSGARPVNMAPTAEYVEKIESNKSLEQNIALGNIDVSPQAREATIVPLTADTVRSAVQAALLLSNYAVRDVQAPHLLLHATLVKIDAPYLAFNITTTSTIHYELTSQNGSSTIWQETIMMPYTAPFSESFNGEERVRLSIEKSIRENVTHMLVALSGLKFATEAQQVQAPFHAQSNASNASK